MHVENESRQEALVDRVLSLHFFWDEHQKSSGTLLIFQQRKYPICSPCVPILASPKLAKRRVNITAYFVYICVTFQNSQLSAHWTRLKLLFKQPILLSDLLVPDSYECHPDSIKSNHSLQRITSSRKKSHGTIELAASRFASTFDLKPSVRILVSYDDIMPYRFSFTV